MTEIPELKGKLKAGPRILFWLLVLSIVGGVIAFLLSEDFTRVRRTEVRIQTSIGLAPGTERIRVQTTRPRRGTNDALYLHERFGGPDAQKDGTIVFSPHPWCTQERGKQMVCKDLRSVSPAQLAEIRERLLKTSEPKLTEDQLPPALR